jgi:hypothetical protein
VHKSDPRLDFMGQIGGLLGLCIGISVITFIELFWLVACLSVEVLRISIQK